MARLVLPLSAALLTLVGAATPTGMLVPDALAQVMARRPEEEGDADAPLLVVPGKQSVDYLAHRSHSSHSSHRSHSSHFSGSGRSYTGSGRSDFDAPEPAVPTPPPTPPKPAVVSFAAYPGGRIYVDGKLAGTDTTAIMSLSPGHHSIRVENRFVGDHNTSIDLDEAQTGTVDIKW